MSPAKAKELLFAATEREKRERELDQTLDNGSTVDDVVCTVHDLASRSLLDYSVVSCQSSLHSSLFTLHKVKVR